ncbi:hypothetical protein CDAR_384351 [Caerostris darwini]|uniref:Uncharacterized protein n=1 Tax=Caerostris darwini TaxID=1538125 RepID=A0AAV4M5A1_9ARAC|nr:hypothetical protein CDAR_384351 [Caerostris darwini]
MVKTCPLSNSQHAFDAHVPSPQTHLALCNCQKDQRSLGLPPTSPPVTGIQAEWYHEDHYSKSDWPLKASTGIVVGEGRDSTLNDRH